MRNADRANSISDDRPGRHAEVAAGLRRLSDDELRELLTRSAALGVGIGGVHSVIEIRGIPVFVKRIPLTSVELRPGNYLSTRNLFDLPLGCQYGVGSPGFGVWREVAANRIATRLVRSGELGAFASCYHWRTLDGPPSDGPAWSGFADIDAFVDYWHGSPGIRSRVVEIAAAPAHVALFLEYIPMTLPSWLADRTRQGETAASAAIDFVERRLLKDVFAMNAAGLFHFDAHFDNVLTDGNQIYFADLGLSTSTTFELSEPETEFLHRNASHDVCHTITRLVDWLVTRFVGTGDHVARDNYIASITPHTHAPAGINASAWRVITRYAPVATVVNTFYSQLHGGDRTTPYPTALALEACEKAHLETPGPGSRIPPGQT
ncbi:MAG: serine/threonine protein phosphatase [Actinomycetota bacterium]